MTPLPESLIEIRRQVRGSICLRLDGVALAPDDIAELTAADRKRLQLRACPKLVEELVAAEREWTSELWRRRFSPQEAPA